MGQRLFQCIILSCMLEATRSGQPITFTWKMGGPCERCWMHQELLLCRCEKRLYLLWLIRQPKKKYDGCLSCKGLLEADNLLCNTCLNAEAPQECASSSRLQISQDRFLKKASPDENNKSAGQVTRKDLGLHKLVFDCLAEGTEVVYKIDEKILNSGYIKDRQIYCNHCNRVVSPSTFEAHAGEGSRRKPYNSIEVSNGVTLHALSLKLAENRKIRIETDSLCGKCGRGEDLIACNICPRAFHQGCSGIIATTQGKFYCYNCTNLRQKEKELGGERIEQIMKRCIRIVPLTDDLGGCTICKRKDFSKAAFDERTVMLCDQCEREYHVGCLRNHGMDDLKELPPGEWFCCIECFRMHSSLEGVILQGAEPLIKSDVDLIRRKCELKGLSIDADMDIRWRLLTGKKIAEDGSLLLSKAITIFHESFSPIIEDKTGRDLIVEMVNGTKPKENEEGQDYSGMYCAVLTVGSTVASAALVRILGGSGVAELPLVATSKELQGLGYFQALFGCIQRLLESLKIKHFVLPAAEEAIAIWTKKFDFTRIPMDHLEKYLNGVHLTLFFGTTTLYRALPIQ